MAKEVMPVFLMMIALVACYLPGHAVQFNQWIHTPPPEPHSGN
jgi:hypothetical protein